jgi:toxin FitB
LNGFLLDTNVLAALRRPAENRAVAEFISVQPQDLLHVSEVTLAEIRYGIALKDEPSRRADLEVWLDQTVRRLFEGRVHGVTEDVLLRWLLIQRDGKQNGHTYAQQDALIAAIAATTRLVVVSQDETHFVRAGVPTLNPWRSLFYSADGSSRAIRNLISATLLMELPD